MTKFNKCTCVKVNKEKMDLIKAKGLNLQDLLDKAMDDELKLSDVSNVQHRIDEITLQIEKLKKERDEALQDCEKKIEILMKNLTESKNKEEDYYNKHIKYLEMEREYIKNHLK